MAGEQNPASASRSSAFLAVETYRQARVQLRKKVRCTAARSACEACSPRFLPPVCLLRLVPRPPVLSPPPASLLEPAGVAPPAGRSS
eukprot:scaffold20034_cov29-Phaeocystis_antarctica.AAC.1